MNKSRNSRAPESDMPPCAGTLLAGITEMVNHAGRALTFKCDACEQATHFDQAVTSPILPCSLFCSADCRDEAELAAENARQA